MIDYSIAFLIPNGLICDTIRSCLKELKRDYVVEEISFDRVLERAQELVRKGTKVLISMGVSLYVLRKQVQVPVLDLAFSGHEIVTAVKLALDGSTNVVHLGSQEMYHFIQKSLSSLNLPQDEIAHRDFNSISSDYDTQVIRVLQEGFDCIIGGSRTVKVARGLGVKGVAFNIDEIMVENIIHNATFIRDFQAEQERKTHFMETILRCSSEGLILVNERNRITTVNAAGAEIFDAPPEELIGRDIDNVLSENDLIDVFKERPQLHEISNKERIVVLHREPVAVNGRITGEVVSIRKVTDVEKLEHKIQKNLSYNGYQAKYTFKDIVGSSNEIEKAKRIAHCYSKYDSTILITGETGTGKELFAQSIHNESTRKGGPFVAVNCAAFPESLIESELFGYDKGSFTGAVKEGKSGLFERAHGGTIFLDEISELPINLQSKLLRVIQEREIVRVGGSKVVPIDVRIISSSNKNLLQLVESKLFKEDLYYRLSVLELQIPPLRLRREDIRLLVVFFMRQNNKYLNTHYDSIEPGALLLLEGFSWKGNIRELRNIMERVMVLSSGPVITEENIRLAVNIAARTEPAKALESGPMSLKDYEKMLIEKTLKDCNGNRGEAAKLLGISSTTIWRKLKE